MEWYQGAVERQSNDEGGEYDSLMEDPLHDLLSHQASMYRTGGHGLTKDAEKAGQTRLDW